MHVNGSNFGEPKKGYLNVTLGNLWATQPIALLIWPPLRQTDRQTDRQNDKQTNKLESPLVKGIVARV